jgi:hypothetical protein
VPGPCEESNAINGLVPSAAIPSAAIPALADKSEALGNMAALAARTEGRTAAARRKARLAFPAARWRLNARAFAASAARRRLRASPAVSVSFCRRELFRSDLARRRHRLLGHPGHRPGRAFKFPPAFRRLGQTRPGQARLRPLPLHLIAALTITAAAAADLYRTQAKEYRNGRRKTANERAAPPPSRPQAFSVRQTSPPRA